MNMQHRNIRPAGLTIDEFLAFTETRPDGERWELIEGQPVLNPSPLKIHQVIAGNILQALLNEKDRRQARWLPMMGIGMLVPSSKNSLPVPDLHVLENEDADEDSHHTGDSLILIEVLSRSNTRARREWRRRHFASVPNLQHYLTIATRRIEVRRYDRSSAWGEVVLGADAGGVELTAIGHTLTFAQIYRHTKWARTSG